MRLTDDRIEDFPLDHDPGNDELAKVESDEGVVAILRVEAVEPEHSSCERRQLEAQVKG